MDEDCTFADRLQAIHDTVGAFGSADDQFADFKIMQGMLRKVLLTASDHHANLVDQGMAGHRLNCPAKNGFAADRPILLGHVSAQAFAFPGSDNEGCDGHVAGA